MPDHTPPRPGLLALLAVAAGFALAHTQSPLFYSNQNQYLLHGLAEAGYGHLDRDWLATTKDPTPVFSALVAAGYRVGGLWAIQAAFFVLLMGYFLAAWWLVCGIRGGTGFLPSPLEGEGGGASPPGEGNSDRLIPSPGSPAARHPLPQGERVETTAARGSWGLLLGFAALFTVAHAALLRLVSVWLTGVDYPWYLQAGVAGQYVLGPGVQPSAFGVLLVASLAAWVNGRPYLAAALGAGACVFHATYLLPAALLTAGYCYRFIRDGQGRTAVRVGAVALAVVLPVVAYTLMMFSPSGPKLHGSAQYVLAEVRIPHHTNVGKWFDVVAALQVVWIAVGIALLRQTRLFVPLLVAAGGGTLLSLAQVTTVANGAPNYTLALLFPWRISVVLVPVTTAVVAVKLARLLSRSRTTVWALGSLFVALAAGGIVVMAFGLGYHMNEAEVPVLEWVRDHAGPDDVYLIPTRIPPVGTGPRGSASNSFTPPPRAKDGSNLIPVDFQRFRLATGVPIYADFKSVPYADTEVSEWYARVGQVEKWYAELDWDKDGVRDQLLKAGITHVLVPKQQAVKASFLDEVYADGAYTVYRVR